MTNTYKRIMPAALLLATGLPLGAQTFNNLVNGGVADWATADWDNGVGVPPTATDVSFLNGDNTVTVQSGTAAVVGTLRLGDSGVLQPSLTIANGGSLAVTDNIFVANAADANFRINVAGDLTANAVFLGGGQTTDTAGLAQIEVSGGSLVLDSFIEFRLGGGTNENNLIVSGEGATQIAASQIQFSTTASSVPGNLTFNLGAFGVTPISLSGSVFGADNLNLTVDGSNYIGGPAKITLIDTDTDDSGGDSVFGTFASISLENFASKGLEPSVAVEEGDLVLTLAQKITGAIALEPDTNTDELTLSFGFTSSPDLQQPFTPIDLTGATLEVDPSDPTKIRVVIPNVTEDQLFLKLDELQ